MKRIMTIFLAVIAIALTAHAQIVQPIKWTGTVEGDSVIYPPELVKKHMELHCKYFPCTAREIVEGCRFSSSARADKLMDTSSEDSPEKNESCVCKIASAQRRSVLPRRSRLSSSHLACCIFWRR